MIKAMTAIMLVAAGGLLTAAVAERRADADNLIAARQAAMAMSGAILGGMKGAIDRGDDVKTQAFAAKATTQWAHALPVLFPPGSDGGTTKALPSAWSDRAGFERAAANLEGAAQKLGDLARAGDQAGFAAQWAVVRGTCSACHDGYRRPDQK